MNDNSTAVAADKIGEAAKAHSGNAVIVQTYALSALSQPTVDFSGFDRLAPLQAKINNGLGAAKESAHLYLNTVLPNAIVTISNIGSYYDVQNAIPDALAPGTSRNDAVHILRTAQEQAAEFRAQTAEVLAQLQKVRDAFSANSSAFTGYAKELSAIVDGDHGVLNSLNDELSGIDGKIAGAITGVVLSGLAIVGGVLMVGIGALTEVVTGGLSTALVVGGVAVAAVGVAGEVASSLTLAKLLDLKTDLLRRKALLKSETTLAAGLASGMSGLASSASSAATATQGMANAWTLLGDDLDGLITDLRKGQQSVDGVRILFTHAAQGAVRSVRQDVTTIREQLSGTKTVVDPKTTPAAIIRRQVASAA